MKRFLYTAAGVCAFVALKIGTSMGAVWGGLSSSAVEWGVGAVLGASVIVMLSPWLKTRRKQRRTVRPGDLTEGFEASSRNE